MVTRNEKILALADLFLAAMPERHMIRWSPEDYGDVVTDDHRLFCWNEIVDVYELFPDEEIDECYERYVTQGTPMGPDVISELEMEEALMTIIDGNLAYTGPEPVVIRISRDESGNMRRGEPLTAPTNVSATPGTRTDSRLDRLTKPNREDMH